MLIVIENVAESSSIDSQKEQDKIPYGVSYGTPPDIRFSERLRHSRIHIRGEVGAFDGDGVPSLPMNRENICDGIPCVVVQEDVSH
jgi:hypothetical protein